jgi:hypothetical protein
MISKPTTGIPMPPVHEAQRLRCAFERLEGIGATNSPAIDNLKRILLLRVAELESTLEHRPRAQAWPTSLPLVTAVTCQIRLTMEKPLLLCHR